MQRFLYFFVLLFLASCTSNTIYKEPENLIPKDSMITLLADMYIASSAKNVKNKFLKREKNYMMLVYKKHKIDSSRFKISNTYYTSKPEVLTEILAEAKKILDSRKKYYEKELRISDSINGKKELEKKNVKKPFKLDSLVPLKNRSLE